MITINDLKEWKGGSEPIVNGPILLTPNDEELFLQHLDKQIIAFDEFEDLSNDFNDEQKDYLYNKFVEFINNSGKYTWK